MASNSVPHAGESLNLRRIKKAGGSDEVCRYEEVPVPATLREQFGNVAGAHAAIIKGEQPVLGPGTGSNSLKVR